MSNGHIWETLKKMSSYDFLNWIRDYQKNSGESKLTYKLMSSWTEVNVKTLEGYFSRGKYSRKLPFTIRRLIYLEALHSHHVKLSTVLNKKNRKK